jgi:hypothetical protein
MRHGSTEVSRRYIRLVFDTWYILQSAMLIKFIQVQTYIKRSTKSRSDLKVQIIEYEDEAITAILTGFYATHLINIITCTTAYSVFPIPTFVHHKGYFLESPVHKFLTQLQEKWQSRGWEFHEPLHPGQEGPSHSFQWFRRFGDRFTWKMFLGTPDPNSLSEYASRLDTAQNVVFGMIKKKYSDYESPPIFSHYEIKVRT